MKKMMIAGLAIALLLVGATACSPAKSPEPTPGLSEPTPDASITSPDVGLPPEGQTTDPALTDDPNAGGDPDAGGETGLPNPVVEVESAEAIQTELGIAMILPDGSTGMKYAIIGGKTAQAQFTYQNNDYTYRIEKTDAKVDISGMFVEFAENKDMTRGDYPYSIAYNEGAEGVASWYDQTAGATYSISMDAGASEAALQSMAEALIPAN